MDNLERIEQEITRLLDALGNTAYGSEDSKLLIEDLKELAGIANQYRKLKVEQEKNEADAKNEASKLEVEIKKAKAEAEDKERKFKIEQEKNEIDRDKNDIDREKNEADAKINTAKLEADTQKAETDTEEAKKARINNILLAIVDGAGKIGMTILTVIVGNKINNKFLENSMLRAFEFEASGEIPSSNVTKGLLGNLFRRK